MRAFFVNADGEQVELLLEHMSVGVHSGQWAWTCPESVYDPVTGHYVFPVDTMRNVFDLPGAAYFYTPELAYQCMSIACRVFECMMCSSNSTTNYRAEDEARRQIIALNIGGE